MGFAAYGVLITTSMQLVEHGMIPDFVIHFVIRFIVARRAAVVSSQITLLSITQLAVSAASQCTARTAGQKEPG